MKNDVPYYIHILTSELQRRQRVNPSYSLRSFARFLDLDSGVLSAILNNKRKVPNDKIYFLCERLKLESEEKKYFLMSHKSHQLKYKNGLSQIKINSEWNLEDSRFIEENNLTKKVLSEWEYFAFLSLIDTCNFKSDPKWIAKRLNISIERTRDVISCLLQLELISQNSDKQLLKNTKNIHTSNGVESQALKHSHRESLVKALDKIDTISLKNRSYSSMTMAFNLNKMNQARELIKEFRRRFSEILEEPQDGTEVYQLAIQFFPLTELLDHENEINTKMNTRDERK